MTIAPIPPIAAAPSPLATTRPTESSNAAADFGSSLSSALDQLDTSHKTTDELARAAATGDLQSVEELMVSSTETQLATQLTVAVRNRAVESFNEIMRMQL